LISYHFYRLISRAKNIYFIYNDDATGMNSGEKSRFLSQLEINSQKKHNISKLQYFANIPLEQKKIFEVVKDSFVLESLKNLATLGFSASSLTSYIRNQEDFYKRYVLKIKQFDEVEENIAQNTFGTIIHTILENLFKPYLDIYLNIEIMDEILQKVEEETHQVFSEIYKKGELKKGKNLVSYEVAIQYIKKYLEIEKKSLEQDSVKILGLEKQYEIIITDKRLLFPVKLKGNIDRIELRNSVIRIIDFKTGTVVESSLSVSNLENLTSKVENDKKIQLLCYLLLTQDEPEFKNHEVQSGIISFKTLSKGFLTLKNKLTEKNVSTSFSPTDLENFKQELISLILEIFDPKKPFIGE
jgi:ATP-dependent helicase/nuclease subunit B